MYVTNSFIKRAKMNHILKESEGVEFVVREMMIMAANIRTWFLLLTMLSSNQLLSSSQAARTPSGKSMAQAATTPSGKSMG